MLRFVDLAQQAVGQGASDVIISAGSPPVFRRAGRLLRLSDSRLGSADLEAITGQLLSDHHRQALNQTGEVEFSHGILGTGRFRICVFHQRGSLGLVARVIPVVVPHPAELGLPDEAYRLAATTQGLLLVGGRPGSGRSTTLAALMGLIADQRPVHLVTLERPVEFLLRHGQAMIHQREVGSDTTTFASGLRAAARQAADVIMLSELEPEVILPAIELASGSALVLAAVSGSSLVSALASIIETQPPDLRARACQLLAGSLRGVIFQKLVPAVSEHTLRIVCEVLQANEMVRTCIEGEEWDRLEASLAAGALPGSLPIAHSLHQLISAGHISDTEWVRHLGSGGLEPCADR